jgi:membrane-associated phospholipid phosphatase
MSDAGLELPLARREQYRVARDIRWLVAAGICTLLILLAVSSRDLTISLALAGFRGGAFGLFVQEWGRKPASLLILAAAVVLTNRSLRSEYPLVARASAAVLVQLLLQPALLTNALKLLSGRARPLQIGPTGEGFAPFYELSPGFGDFSFPSGHVAVAMILAPCVVLLWRERQPLAAFGLALVTLGWAGTVAFGRVSYGAHFPTDVLFSIGIGVALAPLSLRLGDAIVTGTRSS